MVGSWPYPQTLDYAGKACQGQRLEFITKISKLQTKKIYNVDTRRRQKTSCRWRNCDADRGKSDVTTFSVTAPIRERRPGVSLIKLFFSSATRKLRKNTQNFEKVAQTVAKPKKCKKYERKKFSLKLPTNIFMKPLFDTLSNLKVSKSVSMKMLRGFKLYLLRSCFYAFIWLGNFLGHVSKIFGCFLLQQTSF